MGSAPCPPLPARGPLDPNHAQLFARPAPAAQQQPGPGRVRARRDPDHPGQAQPQGLHEPRPLAAVDLLARLVAPLALACRARDAWAVPAPRRRGFRTTPGLPEAGPPWVGQTVPRAPVAPRPTVGGDTLPLGIRAGEPPPLAAADHPGEKGVEDSSH